MIRSRGQTATEPAPAASCNQADRKCRCRDTRSTHAGEDPCRFNKSWVVEQRKGLLRGAHSRINSKKVLI